MHVLDYFDVHGSVNTFVPHLRAVTTRLATIL